MKYYQVYLYGVSINNYGAKNMDQSKIFSLYPYTHSHKICAERKFVFSSEDFLVPMQVVKISNFFTRKIEILGPQNAAYIFYVGI